MGGGGYQKMVCLAALGSLVHCAYSAAQHRSYLRLTGIQFEALPVDIVLQTLVSLLVLCYWYPCLVGREGMGGGGYQKMVCLAALGSLVHCAYSAAQHRSYLRLTGIQFEALPVDIVLQTLVSLLVLCYWYPCLVGREGMGGGGYQKMVCLAALGSLVHYAYSAAQHRSYLRLTGIQFEALPVDIVLQTLVSLLVLCYWYPCLVGRERMGGGGYQKMVCLAALGSLVHCAYSAAQHRSYLRLTGIQFEALPVDIVVQTLVSLLVLCYWYPCLVGREGMGGGGYQKMVCLAALGSLVHCAYSAAQHRSYLRLTWIQFEALPVDIVLQTLVSLLVLCYWYPCLVGREGMGGGGYQKMVCLAALGSLVHCAYSAAQHRSYLRLRGIQFEALPVDIVLQTLVSLLVLCYWYPCLVGREGMGGGGYQKMVCLAALGSLVHCAYSAAQHRSYLRLRGIQFEALPVDIVLQTLVSLLVLCYCAGYVGGELVGIRAETGSRWRSLDTLATCPSFISFHHRAKALSPYLASHRYSNPTPRTPPKEE